MAGFVVLYQADTIPLGRGISFWSLLQQAAQFKLLKELPEIIEDRFCYAARLKAPSSLHRGIARDVQSGSWLMAIGAVEKTLRATSASVE